MKKLYTEMGDQKVEAGTSGDNKEFSSLIERINRLEDEIKQTQKQQTELTHKISKQSDRIDKVTEKITDMEDAVDTLQSNKKVQDSQITNVNKSLDALETSLEDTKSEIIDKNKDLKRRLNAIENMLDIDQEDIAKAIKPDACELEQLSAIPEESRSDEFAVRVQRAIALYEDYHEIATPVKSGGERVLSKDIKTYLNGYSDHDIRYSQVQRVIDSFDEKTDDEFTIKNTQDGRAIVRHQSE